MLAVITWVVNHHGAYAFDTPKRPQGEADIEYESARTTKCA